MNFTKTSKFFLVIIVLIAADLLSAKTLRMNAKMTMRSLRLGVKNLSDENRESGETMRLRIRLRFRN